MKITVLGAGNVGGGLGRALAERGHEVIVGVRRPDGNQVQKQVAAAGPNASASSIAEAAAAGEVVVLAVPYSALPGVLQVAGDLAGKIVIDVTNDWSDGPQVAVPTSAAEQVAALIPQARVVKAFNTLGWERIEDPRFGGLRADVYVCSDDEKARRLVGVLAEEIGFRAVDGGPLRNARATEQMAVLWMDLATRGGRVRNVAFRLLDKD